jgi:hypothetical protein
LIFLLSFWDLIGDNLGFQSKFHSLVFYSITKPSEYLQVKSLIQPQSSGDRGAHHAALLMEHGKFYEERCHSRQPLSPASYTSSVGVRVYFSLSTILDQYVVLCIGHW